eukprot:g5209.t1
MGRAIIVRISHSGSTLRDINYIFGEFGKITKSKKIASGAFHIEFENEELIDLALALDNKMVGGGTRMQVKLAPQSNDAADSSPDLLDPPNNEKKVKLAPQSNDAADSSPDLLDPPNNEKKFREKLERTSYIGSIASEIKLKDIVELASTVGTVKVAKFAGSDKAPTRFCFVEFENVRGALYARKTLHNRKLGKYSLCIKPSHKVIEVPKIIPEKDRKDYYIAHGEHSNLILSSGNVTVPFLPPVTSLTPPTLQNQFSLNGTETTALAQCITNILCAIENRLFRQKKDLQNLIELQSETIRVLNEDSASLKKANTRIMAEILKLRGRSSSNNKKRKRVENKNKKQVEEEHDKIKRKKGNRKIKKEHSVTDAFGKKRDVFIKTHKAKTAAQLKKLCHKAGLMISGTKDSLCNRLWEYNQNIQK